MPHVSVIVPVRNEADNIRPLIAEIAAALCPVCAYEIVYVDDGSTDATPERLAEAAALHPELVRLRHRASCGQSAAIVSGARIARGTWIATIDGDGQNDPADIPALLARAEAEDARLAGEMAEALTPPGPVLVAGWRQKRKDTWVKRRVSRIANAIRARLLRDRTPDTGCGLKVFRAEAFRALPHFDHMHRYLPALFLRAGGHVVSVPVNHRPRERGRSNYGVLDRLWVGIFDLVGVMWLMRRGRRALLAPVPPAKAPATGAPAAAEGGERGGQGARRG